MGRSRALTLAEAVEALVRRAETLTTCPTPTRRRHTVNGPRIPMSAADAQVLGIPVRTAPHDCDTRFPCDHNPLKPSHSRPATRTHPDRAPDAPPATTAGHPAIPIEALDAARQACGGAYDDWHRTANRDAYVGALVARAGRAAVEAAAPHIADQERVKIARDLLVIADDEARRPSRNCCSHAIETAYREAALTATELSSTDLADVAGGRA